MVAYLVEMRVVSLVVRWVVQLVELLEDNLAAPLVALSVVKMVDDLVDLWVVMKEMKMVVMKVI